MFQVSKQMVVDVIDSQFNHDGIMTHKTLDQVRALFDGEDQLTEDGDVTELIIIIGECEPSLLNRQGIHLNDLQDETELSFYLTDAINRCFRDGFTRIYIHQKSKSLKVVSNG